MCVDGHVAGSSRPSNRLVEKPLSFILDEQTDQFRNLIAQGKKRGYLLHDDVNDVLPQICNRPKK